MKWLKLSVEDFEPIPDIHFSLKKPLFAASVALTYAKHGHELRASAELAAKIPVKGRLRYQLDAVSIKNADSQDGGTFSFSRVSEHDTTGGHAREIHANGQTLTMKKTSGEEVSATSVDVINESPAPVLAHLFVLPAFKLAHDSRTHIYAGHVAVGTKIEAIRLERLRREGVVESFEGKFISVPQAVNEHGWSKLPWSTKKGFEFDWNIETKTLVAARFRVPVIGKIEIK